MAYPSTVREIEDGVAALAAAHPALCTRTVLPNATHEGRRVSSIRVASATATAVRPSSSSAARTPASGRRPTRC